MSSIRRLPILTVIDLVVKELDERQIHGHLPKHFSQTEKNAIAMKFVDLHDRVNKNQRVAMLDTQLTTLNKREKERVIDNKKA